MFPVTANIRVRGILERLLRDNPGDLDLKKSLINVHSKVGDTKRVVELYESIAQDLVSQQSPIEAIKYLQKILLIDRARKDVSDKIRSLYELDERTRSRRRSLMFLGALFVLFAGMGMLWFIYENHARERFDRIDVGRELSSKDFAGAVAKYEQFQKDHPLTMVSRDAQAQISKIEAQRLAHEAGVEETKRVRDDRLRKIRSAYHSEWEHHEELFRTNRLDQALDSLEIVKKKVQEAGDDEDRLWAARIQLEKSIRDLRNFLSEAVAIERSARERLDQGDWQGARKYLLELTDKYAICAVARSSRLPVLVISHPPGATVWRDGVPVSDEKSGKKELCTPVVLLCASEAEERIELRKVGFEPHAIAFDPRKTAQSESLLTIVPDRSFRFDFPAQTVPGLGRGMIVAGLRGGNLGVASLETGKQLFVAKLRSLAEVVGVPTIASDRVFFRTNEGNIACHALQDGHEQWSTTISATPLFDPIAKDGRVFVGDEQGHLACFDMESGTPLWNVSLGGLASGPPSVEARMVAVATQSGDLLLLDASDGTITKRIKLDSGASTSPFLCDGGIVLGTTDGKVLGVRTSDGRHLFETSLGRSIRSDEIVATEGSVVVIGPDDTLVRIETKHGQRAKECRLGGRRIAGPAVVGENVFCVLREDLGKGKFKDRLVAYALQSLEPIWEYRDGGTFGGRLVCDERAVYLSTADGKVLRFK